MPCFSRSRIGTIRLAFTSSKDSGPTIAGRPDPPNEQRDIPGTVMTTRILVIDDDELVRATLTRILLAADFEVLEATDGKNGLQKYQEGNIDLVITDILMPVMEGVETIRELRRVDADAKIIAISGGDRTGNMNYLELAGKLGADGILAKPILRQDLMTKIEAILGT